MLTSIPIKIKSLDSEKCYRYLLNHPDADIVNLITVIHKAANHIDNKYQRKMIKLIMNIGLSTCCRNESYAKILSDGLSTICGRDIQINVHKKFNKFDSAIIGILLRVLSKTMHKDNYRLDEMHKLLGNCSNDVVSFTYTEIKESMKMMLTEKEYYMVMPLFDTMMYVLYQDTAYRDVFFWILNEVASPDLRKILKPFVSDPYDWYVNIWYRSKQLTNQQRNDGLIPRYEHCVIDRRMIPSRQTKELNRLAKEG